MLIDNAEKLARRESRLKREYNAQLLAMGVAIGSAQALDSISPDKFLDQSISNVVEMLKSWESLEPHDKETVHQWFRDKCGVDVQSDEKVSAAILRTVVENSDRQAIGKVITNLAMMSGNYAVSDSAFIEAVKSCVNEV